MRVPRVRRHSSKFQNTVTLVAIGLVVGLILSSSAYYILTKPNQLHPDITQKNSLNSSTVALDGSNTLVARKGAEWIFRAMSDTTDLHDLSATLQSFSTEDLLNAIQASASQPFVPGLYHVQEIMCEYLVEKSPDQALESVWAFDAHRKSDLLALVFRNWAVQDMEESLQVATGLTPPYREIAISSIVDEIDLTDELLSLLEATYEFNLKAIQTKRNNELNTYQAINQDPGAVFDQLLSDDIEDYEQLDLLSQTLSELFKLEGIDVLRRINGLSLNSDVSDELILQIVAQDRMGTLEYLQNVSYINRTQILFPLMEDWVNADLENALEVVQGLPNPIIRRDALSRLLSVWGTSEPFEVLNRLEELPRSQRASAVFSAVQTLGSTDPDSVLRLLPSLKEIPGAFNAENERTFVYSWSTLSPSKATNWVLENTELGSERRARLLNWVIREYARVEPSKALDIATAEEPNAYYGDYGLELKVIETLIMFEFDAALGVLDQIRSEARYVVYSEVAKELVEQSRIDEAISLSERVPREDRASYFYRAINSLSYNNASGVLSLVTKIPDTGLRSEVVTSMLNQEWMLERFYTAEQVETLRTLDVD